MNSTQLYLKQIETWRREYGSKHSAPPHIQRAWRNIEHELQRTQTSFLDLVPASQPRQPALL